MPALLQFPAFTKYDFIRRADHIKIRQFRLGFILLMDFSLSVKDKCGSCMLFLHVFLNKVLWYKSGYASHITNYESSNW